MNFYKTTKNSDYNVGDLILSDNYAHGFDFRFLIVLSKIQQEKILERVKVFVCATQDSNSLIDSFPVFIFKNDEIIKA